MKLKFLSHKTALTSIAALTVFLPMSACDLSNNFTKIDRTTNSEFQDFRDALAPREAAMGAPVATEVPDLAPYVEQDSKSSKPMPLVSLSINQSIPLREALFELAKQANYDVELDPRISGSIIFTARNRPMDEVIDRICEISGLRYKFEDSTVRIEIDTPYTKNYKVDYLSFIRTNASNIKTDVSVASSGAATTGGGSTFSVDSKAESNFWAELDTNLKQILSSNASPSYLKTNEDPQITLTASNPVNPPAPPIDAAALGEVAPKAGGDDYISAPTMVTSGATAPATTATVAPPSSDPLAAAPAAAVTPAAPVATPAAASDAAAQATPSPIPVDAQAVSPAQQPVLKVESLPTSLSTGGASANGANAVQFTPAYSINKQAGLVSVYANERLHKQIQSYLDELRRSTTSQVLIEAKVLEVSLSDEFATGIDWSLLDRVGDFSVTGTFTKPSLSPASLNGVTFGFAGDDISSFVSALSRFGTVHALASPRLTVLNNQAAVLNVAQNKVYFELDVTNDTTSNGTSSTNSLNVDSSIKTVPEGVLINVLPAIDLDQRTVSMQVRPTVTKIASYVSDPAVAYVAATSSVDIESLIPVVNVQEVDSVLNMKDKQMMVMGGLLQDSDSSTQEGVPVASEVPVVGGLFRNHRDKVSKTELVVFMKATILDSPSDSIHQTDKDLYRMFGQDRRPEKL